MNKIKEAHPNKWEGVDFHGSRGWAEIFMKRKRIKYRKKKSGKEVTALQCVPAFEKFLALVRFKILPPLTDLQEVDSLYGRFPPHLRFNMDQCPLPFVVGQETTFTVASDSDVHIKCPGEALRKGQFTMHVVNNAGNGARRAGWVDLVCKGTGKRVRQTEKELWDARVSVYFQKNAWVDTEVMKQLATKFVNFKTEKYGPDTWVLLYCNNLRAHLADDVKKIFGDSKVFLCFLPPNMTGERRILMTELVDKSVDHVLTPENDEMRVGCFERTGCLITMLPVDEMDAKIRPQGMEEGSFQIPKTRALLDGEVVEQLREGYVDTEEHVAALAEERLNMQETGDDDELLLDHEANEGME